MNRDSSADGYSSSSKLRCAPAVFDYAAEFPLDEPPTLPLRGSSGRYLNGRVMAAMEGPHHASNAAYAALDDFIRLVEKLAKSDLPAPP